MRNLRIGGGREKWNEDRNYKNAMSKYLRHEKGSGCS